MSLKRFKPFYYIVYFMGVTYKTTQMQLKTTLNGRFKDRFSDY